MAAQGPLVRVDTGRRHFIKMTAKDAAAWAAAHPVVLVAVVPEVGPEVIAPEVEIVGEVADEPVNLTARVTALRGAFGVPEPKTPTARSTTRKPAAKKS